jgi:serine/threonine-protein phosphatase 2A regulatory subunit A
LYRYTPDKVPNVRFSVAKAFGEVAAAVDTSVVEGEIKPILFEMEQDADADVRFYAGQSLQQCDNKLRGGA